LFCQLSSSKKEKEKKSNTHPITHILSTLSPHRVAAAGNEGTPASAREGEKKKKRRRMEIKMDGERISDGGKFKQ